MTKPKPTHKYDRLAPAAPAAAAEAHTSSSGDVLAAAIEAARSKRPPTPPAPAYGRRAAGYVQLNVTVRPEVKARLRAVAEREGVTMAEALDELLARLLPPA